VQLPARQMPSPKQTAGHKWHGTSWLYFNLTSGLLPRRCLGIGAEGGWGHTANAAAFISRLLDGACCTAG
jgi:hypothetical protein